jgi:hypothetical protein
VKNSAIFEQNSGVHRYLATLIAASQYRELIDIAFLKSIFNITVIKKPV